MSDPYKWDRMVQRSNRNFSDFDRRYRNTQRMIWLIPVAFITLLIVSGITYYVALKHSERTVTFLVTGKDSVTVSHGSGDNLTVDNEYRVYTDHGTFKVTDTLIYTRFNSADTYGQLREGHTYTCKVAGWRFGLLSWFPNLIKCREGK